MKQTTLAVMIITVLSKVLGFVREMVLSYVYGASDITDAYLISQTIPTVIFSFISAGIATGFVPMYSRVLSEHGKPKADRYTSNLSNALFLFAAIIVIFVLLFTRVIVRLFASGFTGETLSLAVNLTRISVFGVCFTGFVNIFAGYLRLHGSFVVPALIGFPMNLVVILSLFVSARTSLYVLGVGSVVATAAQFLLCIPFLRKVGYSHKRILDFQNKYMKEMFFIALPVIMGTAVNEINVLVNRTLASRIIEGGISALNYANRLNGFVQGIFVVSVTTVLYPIISKMAAEGKMRSLKAYLGEAISMVNLLVIPATVGAMIFAREIVILLFGRGAFTPEAASMTGSALFYYSIGMIAFGLRDVLTRAFYSLQDTRTPMINATIAVVINIVLNIVLSRFLGIGGLALATSVSGIISAVLMFVTLREKIGPFGVKEIAKSFVKIACASLFMGVFAYTSFSVLSRFMSQNMALVVAIGVGALTYGIVVLFMKIPEVDRTVEAVKRRIQRRGKVRRDRESDF